MANTEIPQDILNTLQDSEYGVSSDFNKAHGTGQGFVSPEYDVSDIPIILQQTEKGNFIVHENVVETLSPSTWESGTGDNKSDSVSYYSKEDFESMHGNNHTTLEQYKTDFEGIRGAMQSAYNSPVAGDAQVMHSRLGEVAKDLKVYEDNFKAEICEANEKLGNEASIDCK